MSARKYLKGGALLTGGSIVSSICSFARNIVIARLLSVEDFGIAAIFVITVSLLERMSYLALDKFLVQAADGNDPKVQAVAQAFQAVRGIISAVLLIAFAVPIAAIFGVPEVAWAFQVFAIYPLARGFVHLDLARLQREMRFKVAVWTDTLPQVITLVVAAPLALWLGDYRVMLLIYAVQAVTYLVASHVMAEGPYQLAWDHAILKKMIGFGWPLLINGFLMFGITQGDRAIIGSAFTVEELGWYSAAFSLAMMPPVIFVKVVYQFLLPILAESRDQEVEFQKRSTLTVQLCIMFGTLMSLGFVCAGPAVLLLMYGEKYSEGVAVVGWLGTMQGLRIAKSGPAIVAMSKGETTNPLIANAVRTVGLLLAVAYVLMGYGVVAVALCGVAGEFLGALAAVYLLRRRLALRIRPMLWCLGCSLVVIFLVIVLASQFFDGTRPWIEAPVGSALAIVVVALLSLAFPDMFLLVRRLKSSLVSGFERSDISVKQAEVTKDIAG